LLAAGRLLLVSDYWLLLSGQYFACFGSLTVYRSGALRKRSMIVKARDRIFTSETKTQKPEASR
jgi:hypothetical protein